MGLSYKICILCKNTCMVTLAIFRYEVGTENTLISFFVDLQFLDDAVVTYFFYLKKETSTFHIISMQ